MSTVAKAWLYSTALTMLGCATAPPQPAKRAESHAQILATRTVRTEVEPAQTEPLARRTGHIAPTRLDEAEGAVRGVLRVGDVTDLRVAMVNTGLLLGTTSEFDEIRCEPDIRCLGALRPSSSKEPRAQERQRGLKATKASNAGRRTTATSSDPEVLLRLSTEAVARLDAVNLRLYRQEKGGVERRIRVLGLAEASPEPELQQSFADGWAEFLRHTMGDEPFAAFAAARLQRRPQGGRTAPMDSSRTHTNVNLRELMEFYTGRAEVHRTLQSDRGLGLTERRLAPTLPLDTVEGVQHEPRDYRALMASEVDAKSFVPHPLATLVPADSLVIEFATARDLVTLPKQLDEKLGLILRAVEGRPGDDWVFQSYADQLMIERTALTEKLGHVAIGTAALVIGDPYLREGTDVTLLFEARDRRLLDWSLANFVEAARKENSELESKEILLSGSAVAVHSTPDGRLRRYQTWVGSTLVVSNSRGAMQRILEQEQKATSLSQSPDYRWARSLAPFAVETERALLFFGDAFVERITGPRSKIGESRRLRALAELRAVEYASLLYGWMQGTSAKSLEELLASGWLLRSDLVHFDGSPIRFDPSTGASSRYGTADHLVPITDLEFSKVDKAEANAYAEFRANYERGLRGTLDPTYLRVIRTPRDDQWRTELRILPLSPSGEIGTQFREIVREVGRGAIDVGKSPNGVRVALGISRESPLRDLANDALHGVTRSRELTLAFLGDWVEAGLFDDPWLWTFALADRALPELGDRSEDRSEFSVERNVKRVPLWAGIHVRSPIFLAAALAALRAQSSERLGDWVGWHDAEKYRGLRVTRVDVQTSGTADSSLSLHFAVANDVLVIALDRRILESRVDRVLDGQRPKAASVNSGESQLALTFEHGATHYITNILAAMLDGVGLEVHQRACDGLRLLAGGFGEAAANSAERRRLGMRVLGYAPESPAGPGLTIRQGQCEHPVYGSPFEPSLPDVSEVRSALHAAVRSLASMKFGLAVVPRAAEQEFVGKAEIEWR